MKIGYLGPDGSYSYCAAKKYWEGINQSEFEMIPEPSFASIIQKVEESEDYTGILPLENSTEGIVTPVVDLLYYSCGISIVAEIIIPIRHELFNKSGNIEDIKYIYSNPQPIEQCKLKLAKLAPHAKLMESASSSEACQIAMDKGAEYGAISNEVAGKLYKLKSVAASLQDNEKNATRFVIVQKSGKTKITGKDKTSIAFTFDGDRPGSLYLVLKEFAECGINLSRIESRPMKEELGTYVFYIDFAGHILEKEIILLMEKIRLVVGELKILGSYKLADKL